MYRRVIPFAFAVVAIVSMSLISVSAHNTPGSSAGAAAQSAQKCADKEFLTTLGTDLSDLGASFKEAKMDDMISIAQTMLKVTSARQKWEDLENVPAECVTTQLAAIIAFANGNDLLALGLAVKADPKNAAEYLKAVAGQTERFTKAITNVLIEAGIATPAP